MGLLQPDGSTSEFEGSMVILAADRELVPGREILGGTPNVMDQLEFEVRLGKKSVPAGRTVFLVNGNAPMSAEELGARLRRPPETILRTLAGPRVYRGIRPVVSAKPEETVVA